MISIGMRVLVLIDGMPWYDGIVVSVTQDGQYAEVKETCGWWPDRDWYSVEDLRAIGEPTINYASGKPC